MAVMRMMSPGLNQPARFASSRVVGTLAPDVLPYFDDMRTHAYLFQASGCAECTRSLATLRRGHLLYTIPLHHGNPPGS